MRNGHKNVKIVQCLNPRFVWKAKCRNLFPIVCLTNQMSCQPAMGAISSTVIIEYSDFPYVGRVLTISHGAERKSGHGGRRESPYQTITVPGAEFNPSSDDGE